MTHTLTLANSSRQFKVITIAFVLAALSMLLPDIALASSGSTSGTGEEITNFILEAVVKYGNWIFLGLVVIAFGLVGYAVLNAYGNWADDKNRDGTLARLILTILIGILILTIVVIFATKGTEYLEENFKTSAVQTTISDNIA